jgi:predicted nucleotidyltransferase
MKLETVRAVAQALNKAGVKCLFAGGFAVVAHGYGRMTYDIDLVLQLDQENILRAFGVFDELGYVPRVPVTAVQFADATVRATWIREKGMQVLNLFSDRHRETPIDIFVEEPFDFENTYAQACVEEIAPGVPIRFVDLQTLIAMKARAGRPKDLDDIAHLRAIQEDDVRG